MEASLYIHVPFCAGSCDYCDFYSVPVTAPNPWSADSRLKAYVRAILLEGERLFEEFHPDIIPSIYIGGGTPSVLGHEGFRVLLNGVRALITRVAPPPEEITVEANPESADEAFLGAAREAGVTRLSLGIQTFYSPSRRAVNRIGPEQCSSKLCSSELRTSEKWLTQRLALAAEYFPGALSVDLISGLPLQDEKILLDDIDIALSFKPGHVSLYALTLEPGTALAERNAAKPFLPQIDEADRLWLYGRDALEKTGLHQYEVSNFCMDGKESRHNIRYWRLLNWLALGPAASGTIINDETGTGLRYAIPPDVDLWLTGNKNGPLRRTDTISGDTIIEELESLTLIKESLLMGFRYINGPDENLFKRRFNRDIGEYIPRTINAWRSRGFLQADKYAFTKEGLMFLDPFLRDAFVELDANGQQFTDSV